MAARDKEADDLVNEVNQNAGADKITRDLLYEMTYEELEKRNVPEGERCGLIKKIVLHELKQNPKLRAAKINPDKIYELTYDNLKEFEVPEDKCHNILQKLVFHELNEYPNARAAQIRLEMVPELIGTDLQELEVPWGPRKRMLKNIEVISRPKVSSKRIDGPVDLNTQPPKWPNLRLNKP
jgi:hypothetical protein